MGMNPGKGRVRSRRPVSPLLRRILLVNILPLAVLVAGLLYVDQYRRALITSEIEALRSQAELVAAALGEGAAGVNDPVADRLVANVARQMVRRLSSIAGARTRLYALDGRLVADSVNLAPLGGSVEIEELPPPGHRYFYDRAAARLRGLFSLGEDLPRYHERQPSRAADYEEATLALNGEPGARLWRSANGGVVVSVAVPVQRFKQVLGAVLLTRDGDAIENALFAVRINILSFFAAALALTVLLSIYLTGTIARPLRRLASAAERVRRARDRQEPIPDLSLRNDEIGDLSAALREMTGALYDRMDAIEAFAADVAHEIKNPLTSLRSAVETVARVSDPDQQRNLMAIILEDVQRLDRLISDISDASRLDADLSRIRAQPVDVGYMLGALAEAKSAIAGDRDVIVALQTDSGPAPKPGRYVAMAVEERLGQVFRNLIANAESFSPPGGTVVIRLARESHPTGDVIAIRIEDTGPGIPEGKLDAIFTRFYSERPEGEKFGTHSGLGLSISRQIVEAAGGSIVAENRRDGPGARFIVRLPAA